MGCDVFCLIFLKSTLLYKNIVFLHCYTIIFFKSHIKLCCNFHTFIQITLCLYFILILDSKKNIASSNSIGLARTVLHTHLKFHEQHGSVHLWQILPAYQTFSGVSHVNAHPGHIIECSF